LRAGAAVASAPAWSPESEWASASAAGAFGAASTFPVSDSVFDPPPVAWLVSPVVFSTFGLGFSTRSDAFSLVLPAPPFRFSGVAVAVA